MNLGTFSFDEVNPGATNGFTINNFTFSFALPPDFPVTDSIVFQNAQVTLTDGNGMALTPILLGDGGPGGTLSPTFLSTDLFQSAEFMATLNVSTFGLSDGSVFLADTNAIDTLLSPSSGSTLTAGVDLAVISVTGRVQSPAGVPEPSGWLLLLTLIGLVAALHGSRALKRRATAKPS
jgi:hypothetical protein